MADHAAYRYRSHCVHVLRQSTLMHLRKGRIEAVKLSKETHGNAKLALESAKQLPRSWSRFRQEHHGQECRHMQQWDLRHCSRWYRWLSHSPPAPMPTHQPNNAAIV